MHFVRGSSAFCPNFIFAAHERARQFPNKLILIHAFASFAHPKLFSSIPLFSAPCIAATPPPFPCPWLPTASRTAFSNLTLSPSGILIVASRNAAGDV